MTAFIIANLAPIMFCGLIVFLLLGFPVAFALAALGLSFGLLGLFLGPVVLAIAYTLLRNWIAESDA